MATIKEDFVSFEIAKLLIRKGFDFNAEYESYYTLGGEVIYFKDKIQDVNVAPRITLQMAMKWLREVCGLIISIEFQAICPTWKWRIYIKASNKKHTDFQHYNKYEEACEAAIKYSLENLI